jgi:hypothetical protein
VQFSGSVDATGAAINRIGTATGAAVSIEEGTNAGLAEWGWGDNSYGGLGSPIYFNATGPQTIRVQVREDGLSLDQIVLSADEYLSAAPGVLKNDATIVQRQSSGSDPRQRGRSPTPSRYSVRSARIGSTAAARRAGR